MTISDNVKRPVVLVHGGFHGGWCWRETATLLRTMGHEVFTPTLTGSGERRHLMRPGLGWDVFVTDIVNVLAFEDLSDVILVGHSFSGATITGVADRCAERLAHLVYLDAMVLQSGQSALDSAPQTLIDGYRARAQAFSGGVSVPPNPAAYYGITDPTQAKLLEERMTPQPFDSFLAPLVLQHPVGNAIPATYVACTRPYLASTASSRRYAQARADWRYVEMDAPHNVMLTAPGAVADLISGVTG